MYCKSCGNQIEEGVAFCPNCGAKALNEPSGGNAQTAQGRVVKRINCDSLAKGILIGSDLLGVIALIAGAYILNNLHYASYETEKMCAILLIIVGLGQIAYGSINYGNYTKRFLSINEHGITGIGQGSNELINESFAVFYKDIIGIKKTKISKNIEIKTLTSKIIVTIPQQETDKAVEMIRKLTQAHKNNQIN